MTKNSIFDISSLEYKCHSVIEPLCENVAIGLFVAPLKAKKLMVLSFLQTIYLV